MVKLISFYSVASVVSAIYAQNVDCIVDGTVVATVDLDTGVCPFTIPQALPVVFDFISPEDYDADFYYAIAQGTRFFNDIANAGRIIEIPAVALYNNPNAPLFHVHSEETPAANSTAAIRKRLFGQTTIATRDERSDFANSLKSIDGTPVDSGVTFEVANSTETTSGSGSPTGTDSATGTGSATGTDVTGIATVTKDETTIITITSCSDHKCTETTVPATPGLTTTVLNGETTIYTTYCPVTATETSSPESTGAPAPAPGTTGAPAPGPESTVASENTAAPAPAESPVSVATVTEVVTEEGTTYTTTSEATVAAESVAPGTAGTETETSESPVGSETVAAVSTSPNSVAPVTTQVNPTISTYGNGASKVSGLAALLLVPLAYLI